MPAANFLEATGLAKSMGGHFHAKKALAASFLAATELMKSKVSHFYSNASLCGKLPHSNRACEIHWWPLSPKISFWGSCMTPNDLGTTPGG